MEESGPSHNPLSDYVIGYPKLAARMAARPETMIFRKFSTLNARTLLYMQAELASLEISLDKLTRQDSMSKETNKKRYATHYGFLSLSWKDEDQEQYKLVMKIRSRLRDYNKLLLQVSQLNALVCPDEYDLYNVQDFLGSDEMGPLALEGEDAYFWGSHSDRKDYKHDIITLKRRQKEDAFSKWVAERAMLIIKCLGVKLRPSKEHGEVVLYDSSILKATFWVTSLVASMLPVASIVVLIHLRSQTARLGSIAAFNVLITLCLNIFTDAKRIDCFAVTAAFTAVQVVFIGVENISGN